MNNPQFASLADYEEHKRRQLIAAGKQPVRAVYDAGGNCLSCGESGRCPGWHAGPKTAQLLLL